jgi:hypothetical protein
MNTVTERRVEAMSFTSAVSGLTLFRFRLFVASFPVRKLRLIRSGCRLAKVQLYALSLRQIVPDRIKNIS